jgi:hypothetical protein
MKKDFEKWNSEKKRLENVERKFLFKNGDI